MSSILERPELNRIFLIYGNLDDMFMTPDLQKNNFRPFLNGYLKSLGYQQIVFYSGAKNVGKYVLDDESAVLAINKNRHIASSVQNTAVNLPIQSNTPKKNGRQRRILSPRERANLENNDFSTPISAENTVQTENLAEFSTSSQGNVEKQKLIYKQPKITPAEFLDDAKKMMSSNEVKTAVVFTFFQDFVTDGAAPMQQYAELLSHLWDEYSLSSNENICIFLAPQMTGEAISGLLERLPSGNVFRNRFFNSDSTINQSCTIDIGLPNRDEFKYMLEYLRIVGESGRRISYQQKDLSNMVSLLMYMSREAERISNRAGYLSSVYEHITHYIKAQNETITAINEEIIRRIYSQYKINYTIDPMKKLSETKGWESIAERVGEIAADYKKKKSRAGITSVIEQSNEARTCSNQRIDIPDKPSFEYTIPHFILKGNPGVGKTTAARLIGQIFYEAGILGNGTTIEATRDDLIDRYVGGTTAKTRETVRRAQEGVLFIDDAYSLLEGGDENNYPKQAIDELVAIMTNTKQYRFCMIMAGYPEPMDELLKMNSGLSSRFSKANILTIEDYKPELLQSIFESNCRKDGYTFAQGDNAPDLKLFFENLYASRDRANFGNARDAVAIAREVKLQSSLRDDSKRVITIADFGDYQKYFNRHGVSSIDDIYAEIDKYVGMDFVKELFENVRLELLDIEDCKRRGIAPDVNPDHYIFAGNPGTGKTTVGKMLGKFYHLMGVLGSEETIFADASDLIGSHVGDSKNKTRAKIQEAIDHNALLYIDEAYQIADTAYSAEIVGAMMTAMTENAADFKMVFGMYSNRVEDFLKLNAGLSRRVRIVEFPDYTPSQLTAIFDRTIATQGRTITDDAHRLIELLMEHKYNTRTESFGNAGEVKQLVADMKKLLLRRVSKQSADIDRYQYTSEDIPSKELELIKSQINPRTFDDIMHDINEQIGMSDLKEIILRKKNELEFARRRGASTYGIAPGYYFFVGNAGTGKSTSAKLFGECLHELGIVKSSNFYSCTAKDLIGQYMGETDKKTYELLKKSINGVLFIDEAYSLSYADSSHADSSYKKEALEQIIAFMDLPEHRSKCCIIMAGYQRDMQGLYKSNSGMRSRIEEVHFKDYTADEMYQIFELFCQKNGYSVDERVKSYYLPIFEKMTHMEYYSNGRTARTVFEKTVYNVKKRVLESTDLTDTESMVISVNDLLSENECMSIVSAN